MSSKFVFTWLLCLFTALPTYANQAWFGVEWTFTDETLIEKTRYEGKEAEVEYKKKTLEAWAQLIQNQCPACRVQPISGLKWQVRLPDGFHFIVGTDLGVFEINANPMTLAEIKKYKDTLQILIWDTARSIGVKPHWRLGGGHIHLDISGHFGDGGPSKSRLLFRNFIVDLMNRPELFMGGLGYDYLNASPLALLEEGANEKFQEILQEYDKGIMRPHDLKVAIRRYIYGVYDQPIQAPKKYEALGLEKDLTLELRGLRPQMSMEHMGILAEIISGRIESLKSETQAIPFQAKMYRDKVSVTEIDGIHFYETDINPHKILEALNDYIRASGVAPERYAPFITEELKARLGRPSEHNLEAYKVRTCRSFLR